MSFKVGIQLYSLSEDMALDMEGTLSKVADMGYEYVEFAGFYDRSAEEVKAMLDRNGLKCSSVHQVAEPVVADPEAFIKFFNTIGCKFCVIPWVDKAIFTDSAKFDKLIADITEAAKKLSAAGIKVLYHNHDFEFDKIDGEYILDIICRRIPADLFALELDTCWAKFAGQDPAEYILKNAGRMPALHLKDFVATGHGQAYGLIDSDAAPDKQVEGEFSFEFRKLGTGVQNFPAIIDAARKAGTEYLIVEHDDVQPGLTALDMARFARVYLKQFGI